VKATLRESSRTTSGGSLAAVTLPSAVRQSSRLYNAENEQTKFSSASSITYETTEISQRHHGRGAAGCESTDRAGSKTRSVLRWL
jgi:hypothetical protein